MELARSTSKTTTTEFAKPFKGRRLSWTEFYQLRPDLRPANDNERHQHHGIRKDVPASGKIC